ncbi:MAG: DNA polymerase I, partial [Candidatus Omnitrophota bacterium]
MPKKLFLIDGNSYCYRAFYAIRSLSNSKGRPTNAIYGFITMFNKLLKEENPDYVAVAFDLKGPTFRHEKFRDYKAHRKPMPDELVEQLPVIKDVLRMYNVPIFQMAGYEADDILATVAKKAVERSIDVYIVTGDKDALQLVSAHIKVYNTHKDGLIYDEAKVREKFGVDAPRMLDLLSLMGDSSDNIPGATGIGEKSAVELISEFGSVENLYKNLERVSSKSKREILAKNREQVELSRELARLDCDVPVDVDFTRLARQEPDHRGLLELFKEMEFRGLVNQLSPRQSLRAEYVLIDTKKALDAFLEELRPQKMFAFDFETTGSDPMAAEAVGVSFCWEEGKASYIPFAAPSGAAFDARETLEKLRPLFEDGSVKKVGQNIKYEELILRNYGIALEGVYFDTMVASYLLNPSKLRHNLGDISLEHLGHKMTDISELIGKGKKQISMAEVPLDRICDYCCEDSDVTLRLANILEGELKKKGLDPLFRDVEVPLIKVLADMEFEGISLDTGYLSGMSKDVQKKLDSLTKDIYESAGCEFNINSPKQLQEILFNKLGLPPVKRTKTGISTDEEVLKRLAMKHSIPALLLEYRELAKLKSTYMDALPKLINAKTGRVHTSFNQTVTATGRLSSSEPNLQNIPIRAEIGKKIR